LAHCILREKYILQQFFQFFYRSLQILKVADKQKKARALIIISESRDDQRKTQKYLKINRWVGTLQNPKIRELSEFEEFNGQMIKHTNLFEMQRNNSGYLKTTWSL
jgi:hypothetical protein